MLNRRTTIPALTILFFITNCTSNAMPTASTPTETAPYKPATETPLRPISTSIPPTETLLSQTETATAIPATTKKADSNAAQLVVVVPPGTSPVIDGTISPGEWEGAAVETFFDGSEILLLRSENYLYLAIRANTTDMVVGNVFINQGDEVAILHVSAALGTAVYHQETDTWQQTRGFEWCCRDSSDSSSAQAEREAFRQQENWMSVNSRVGTPNELEYQIEVESDHLRLAVNYLKVSSSPNDEKIAWPPDLDDDVIKPTPGGLPMQLFFSLAKWGRLDF